MDGSVLGHPSLAAWAALRGSGAREGALITLLRAQSGPARNLGTHFALGDDGRTYGSVTIGGCADGRALTAARRVLASGCNEQLTIPLSEDDALALGLGCAGDLELLVTRVALDGQDALTQLFDAAVAALVSGSRTLLAMSLNAEGGAILVQADGTVFGRVGERAFDGTRSELAKMMRSGSEITAGLHELDGSSWFVQLFTPPLAVLVVGATDVAAALCAVMTPLGWRTTVVDSREELLAEPRFAAARERVAGLPGEIVAARMHGLDTPAVVLVAHDYRVELPVLRTALRGNAPYVGMLGSRKRGSGMRAMLVDEGFTEPELARLRTPVGLSIGAVGPVEIAVSIVAELISTWRKPPRS